MSRDQKWKEDTIRNTSEEQFSQEFECEFLGSVDTLISLIKIKNIGYVDYIQSKGGLKMFKRLKKVVSMFVLLMLLEVQTKITLRL